MKRVVSLLLANLIIIGSFTVVSADVPAWQTAIKKIITDSSGSNFMLMDVSEDGIPELFCPGGNGVVSYYYDGGTMVQAASDATIPYEFVKNVARVRDTETNKLFYMGQVMYKGKIVTYKMSFLNCAPVLEVISEESNKTGAGQFKGSSDSFVSYDDVKEKVMEYLDGFTKEHLVKAAMDLNEARRYGKRRTVERLFGRYTVFSEFSDDGAMFSANQREKIKKNVGKGDFLGFDRITVLGDDVIFVEYFVNNTSKNKQLLSYEKKYSLVSGNFDVITTYENEQEIDPDYLWSLVSPDARPSNFNPEYEKTNGFRGIDDYVTYFSSLFSGTEEINENGKKEIANFMEYAVNRCSRTEIKAINNVLTIKGSDVSIISQNAVNSMGQLVSVCKSKGIDQIRTAKTVPELVCKGLDSGKPIRVEFEEGVSSGIGQASGIRIMLDDSHGIYVNGAELSVLERDYDVFAVEFTKNEEDYSIVFTDKTNQVIPAISMPVWFVVPAISDYSSVVSSFDGGTENRGGQFDERFNHIEFSAVRSGNYQVVEEDITINDIDSVSFTANQAIRFLVSKGVLEVDRNNRFHPDENMNRYDFTKALVSMFYVTNYDAKSSYEDVPKENRYYPYVATAEAMDMSRPLENGMFGGKEAVTNEYMLLMCGKVLAEKKGYKFPDNYVEYLTFLDKSDISASAMPYIAVAVQCGLAENSGEFLPYEAVTREKGAQILYKTFTLLYDTSPVTTSFSAVVEENTDARILKDLTPLQRGIVCVLFTAVMLFGFWALSKKRKPYKKENEE